MSFAEWRQQACLLAALPRLAAGERVTAVALDLGYDSPAAFSTMFRRLSGIAPNRYRSSHRDAVGVPPFALSQPFSVFVRT
jgi:AraC-like DNA-binding protein